MPCRLRREEVVTIGVLTEKGKSKSSIARTLGVVEGTVRYHLKRASEGAVDGRKNKTRKADKVAGLIDEWMRWNSSEKRPVNVKELHEYLVTTHDYDGEYKSVLRYVRAKYPMPKVRTYRRVETPAGAQSQTDWADYPLVDLGNGLEPLHAFIMTLSHSRMPAVVWSRREDQLSWLDCHNGAFRRLQGIPAVNRIDNVKTAIAKGAGCWGEINVTYRAYARSVGFHIDACQPRQANAKGKVEAKVRLCRYHVNPKGKYYDGLEHLQDWTDCRMQRWAKRAVCPSTGKTVYESWEKELDRLVELPVLPEPFDVAVNRPVHKDCMVHFENRSYAVPFRYVARTVEVRGCAGKVQVWADGQVQIEYPRHTEQRVLIDPSCYEGEATERVMPPAPLGRMGRKLQEILEMPVESRPVDLYAALVEVAR